MADKVTVPTLTVGPANTVPEQVVEQNALVTNSDLQDKLMREGMGGDNRKEELLGNKPRVVDTT